MPGFEFTSPEGKKYRVEGPPGATQEQAWSILQGQLGQEPEFDPSLGSLGKAAQAFPGSVKKAGSELWDMVTHAPEVIGAVREKGFEGVFKDVKDDLVEHYGSWGRAQRTFETDPFRFLTDISLPLTGGASILAKTGQIGAKVGRKVLERTAPLMTGAPRTAFETAGAVGAEGGPRAAVFRAGQAGQMPGRRPGVRLTPEYQAGEALSAMLPPTRHADPYRAMMELATRGGIGASASGAATAAGLPWWVAAPVSIGLQSPRAMGSATYGLGAAERGLRGTAGAAGKAAIGSALQQPRELIQDQAQQLLRDRAAKKELSSEDVKTVRAAASGKADSRIMLAASRIIGRRLPSTPQARIDVEHAQFEPTLEGATGEGARATAAPAPAPGEPSKPSTPPELTGETPLSTPGQSRGLGAVPGTVVESGQPQMMPEPERRGGQTLPQFIAEQTWEGILGMVKKPGEAARGELPLEQAMQETDWGPGMAMSMTGAGTPFGFARPGTIGMVGGGMKQPPRPWAGAAPHLVEPVGPGDFHAAISPMQDTKYGAALDPLTSKDYEGMRTRTTPDKTAGYALDGDNITGVYKHPDSPHKNIAPSLLSDAIAEGGRRLDAFDTMLTRLYGENGFRAVARIKFDPAQAPPRWNYETFKKWNNGKPDVVYMVYDPYRPGYRSGDGKLVGSYEEAVALQKAEAAKIAERMTAAEKKFDEIAQTVTGLKKMKEFLTPEELETVTARNTKNLLDVFNQMPGEEMAAVAYSGRAKRGWYRQSAQALVDIFGLDDAPRFTALLAAMSPRISVEGNTINALRTWVEWKKMGSPTDRASILEAMTRGVGGAKGLGSVMESWRLNAIRALTHEDPLSLVISGPKVNSFYRNLGKNMHEVTNDAWMASYAGIKQSRLKGVEKEDPYGYLGTKGPAYVGMNAATRRAAKIISQKTGDVWTPAEVQETVWSWAKTLKEKATSKEHRTTVVKLLKAGNITHAEIANTPDFATLFTQGVYRRILEGGGYGEAIERAGAGAARGGKPAVGGTPLDPEGAAFAGPAFKRHLLRAGRRLDLTRAPEPD